MSPAMKEGGHQQGLKRTVIVAVEPAIREGIEEEVRARQDQKLPGASISDVARDAYEQFLSGDLEKAEELLERVVAYLQATAPLSQVLPDIRAFLERE